MDNFFSYLKYFSFIFLIFHTQIVFGEESSRFLPFEKGDIFVAATIMDDPEDDHAGTGRIFQYDSSLNLKGTLFTLGTTHKVGGLTFSPDGTLWGFSQISHAVIEISPNGIQKPLRSFLNRSFSNVSFGSDGSLYFGEHLQGDKIKIPTNTTVFKRLPGRNVIGDGNIFKFGHNGNLIEEFDTETHGGVAGIHGVTSAVLSEDGERMIYISETGNRVLQYDLDKRLQLKDLKIFDEDDNIFMLLTMTKNRDGSLLLSTGNGFVVIDQNTGDTVNYYEMDSSGWAASTESVDGKNIIAGNFFTGQIVVLNIYDGELVASNFIGEKNSLSGIAQFPGTL